jgi:hypothetical protein
VTNVHLCELRGGTACDLLCAELNKLLLQFIKLLAEVILVLAPELGSLDFSGRRLRQLVYAIIIELLEKYHCDCVYGGVGGGCWLIEVVDVGAKKLEKHFGGFGVSRLAVRLRHQG